jgi:predicted  nucleic acid-binding Zn-ribbon protein
MEVQKMSVTEARQKFEAGKKAVEDCTKLLSDLTKRYDDFQESLPQLKDKIEIAEKSETAAYDSQVLGKISAKELEKFKTECQTVRNQYAESSKMLESLGRGIRKTENDLQRLNAEAELSKSQCWQAIAEEIRLRIPNGVISDIQRLVVASTQCSKTKQFILNELFPNLNPSEYQTRRDELIEKYGIAD